MAKRLPGIPDEMPDDEELKREIKWKLIEMMRKPPMAERRFSVPCKHSPAAGSGKELKHQVNVQIPNDLVAFKAMESLLDRIEGKAATKREAPKPKLSGRPLEELTDEELEQMIGGSDGEADGGAAQEDVR